MLNVGVDSYIGLNEAEEIINSCYINQPEAERWSALSVEEREAVLRTAAYRIDCMPLGGYKHSITQPLQFPRGKSADIPYNVKLAVIEEALAATDTDYLQRLSRRQQGITSVELGEASESYTEISQTYTGALLSVKAYNYLRPYLLGSAVIR